MIPYLTETLGVVAAGLFLTTGVQTLRINTLELELELSEAKTKTCLAEKQELFTAINDSNAKLQTLAVDYNASIEEWNNRESVEVFVDRFIQDSNMTRGDCEDTSAIIDYVRTNSI